MQKKIDFHYVINKDNLFQVSYSQIYKFYLKGEKKIYINVKNIIIEQELDKFLWIYKKKSFLPHGTDKDKFFNQHPILITTQDKLSRNNDKVNIFIDKIIKECECENMCIIFTKNENINLVKEFYLEVKNNSSYQISYTKYN